MKPKKCALQHADKLGEGRSLYQAVSLSKHTVTLLLRFIVPPGFGKNSLMIAETLLLPSGKKSPLLYSRVYVCWCACKHCFDFFPHYSVLFTAAVRRRNADKRAVHLLPKISDCLPTANLGLGLNQQKENICKNVTVFVE